MSLDDLMEIIRGLPDGVAPAESLALLKERIGSKNFFHNAAYFDGGDLALIVGGHSIDIVNTSLPYEQRIMRFVIDGNIFSMMTYGGGYCGVNGNLKTVLEYYFEQYPMPCEIERRVRRQVVDLMGYAESLESKLRAARVIIFSNAPDEAKAKELRRLLEMHG